jgi:tetratricopeptide (TPR) repeat protein
MAQEAPPREQGSALSDIFEEFKEDMEADGAIADEQDPETHYNLGVAFKEMGLLEEAIGELQKVCHIIDRGHPFPHVLQVYTWLAECLVNKGAPQAAIKWYQRALQLPGVDEEIRMAVHYEMAAAYEAGGNRQAALDNFMEVYGNNIDYRDVAERIKTLKA